MSNPIQQARELGQSTWYDNIRRGLITSGELAELIEFGITGMTSNPTIFEKAIAGSTDYDAALLEMVHSGKTPAEAFEALALQDIRGAADLLRGVYDETDGADGYVSLEVPPTLAHDTSATVAEAHRLFGALDRPNVMIKVPATPQGAPAIRQLIADGINTNVTLVFSLDSYRQVMEAYISGMEELVANGGDPSSVASVASFFVSRVDTAVDALLHERIRGGAAGLRPLLGKAAIANARKAYALFLHTFGQDRFEALRAQGARVQRPLWASTSTKDPGYPDTLYVDSLIGPDTVNTMPPVTVTAVLDHGRPAVTLDDSAKDAQSTLDALARADIDMGEVTEKLLADGVSAFTRSYDAVLASIQEKQAKLLAEHLPGETLGEHASTVKEVVERLQRDDAAARIWRKDHTVWRPDPTAITDRLGWLTAPELMGEQVPMLEGFAQEVREAGFRQVVLLGMGGSSLGPEVLRRTFGNAPGYPEPFVLDSTVPGWVRSVTDAIDAKHTLFIVSSKSGGTLEVSSFYQHFRSLLEPLVGAGAAGGHFVAITDQGTSLEELAQHDSFRRTFLNPSDIGGRFSVLSHFGLVPAALMGLDVARLLDRAHRMSEACASFVRGQENPGLWLGAVMGSLAKKGLDKLTLVTSPAIAAYGLWVEQMLAESLGKEDTGIIPVAGEPLAEASVYGHNRLFVYLRLAGDDNIAADAHLEAVEMAGHRVLRLEVADLYDLGGEFYRWEFATAVAGAILGVHPFDQPNVQAAKDLTQQVLVGYQEKGRFADMDVPTSVEALLRQAQPGDYLALLVYLPQTPEIDRLLDELRRLVVERYGIATTAGYGPRYLHSTGQLHKGGPATGLFLQLTGGQPVDLPIPGQSYTFQVLAEAQAQGDLQALQKRGRRLARHDLGADAASGLQQLVDSLR